MLTSLTSAIYSSLSSQNTWRLKAPILIPLQICAWTCRSLCWEKHENKPRNLQHLPRNINSWPFLNDFEPTLSVSPTSRPDFFVAAQTGSWPLFFLAFHRLRRRSFPSKTLPCPILSQWGGQICTSWKNQSSRNEINGTLSSVPSANLLSGPHAAPSSPSWLWTPKIGAVCSPVAAAASVHLFPSSMAWSGAKGVRNLRPLLQTTGVFSCFFATKRSPNGFEL